MGIEKRQRPIEAIVDIIGGETGIPTSKLPDEKRRAWIRHILKTCKRANGEPLSDVAIAVRVSGTYPSEVAAIRAEMVAAGELPGDGRLAGERGEQV